MKKPYILICNDDGIFAPGIKALTEAVSHLGDVLVVAPDKPQSGKGMAITLGHPLRVSKVSFMPGVEAYSCSGTPVDCIKLAMDKLVTRKPDLIVSGINHGSNASINVIYSGTMSAAIEGAMENIPSIGFSLLDHSIDADFSASKTFVLKIVQRVLKNGMMDYSCLNVNIPKIPLEVIKGIKVCRQAKGNWEEDFNKRKDPLGEEYYWMAGKFVNYDKGTDTDIWALENNYVSVVPITFDLTHYKAFEQLKNTTF